MLKLIAQKQYYTIAHKNTWLYTEFFYLLRIEIIKHNMQKSIDDRTSTEEMLRRETCS